MSHVAAEERLPGEKFAWYRDASIEIEGANVISWADAAHDGSARDLTHVVGEPRAVRVDTPSGERTIVRFDGQSALWRPANAWGQLAGERTIVVYLRLQQGGEGFLFDGSTRSGRSSAHIRNGHWHVGDAAAKSTHAAESGTWQMHAFLFRPAGENTHVTHVVGDKEATATLPGTAPLGGFIVGADVATQRGLACDVAEILVAERALSRRELSSLDKMFRDKWGHAQDLPKERQPRPAGIVEDPRVFHTYVRRHGDDGVHTYRIPALVVTPQGTLIAAFDLRHNSSRDLPGNIDVGIARSTDRGETWSDTVRALDFDASEPNARGNGVGDPALLVDRNTGTVFVAALWSKGDRAWSGSGPGLSPDETGQFAIAKSTDEGRTWSAPISITPQIKQPEWHLAFNGPGNGIQLRDGTLVFPAQFRDAQGKASSCFIFSRDAGETWTISPPAIPGHPPTSEAAIAECRDGSLLISMRNEARTGQRAWSRWTWRGDLGKGQWSEPWFDLPDPTCMASLVRHPQGPLLFSNPASTTRRHRMTIRISEDEGRTWSEGRLLDSRAAMYSCLAVLHDGQVGLLYEGVGGLIFARFPLDWVAERQTPAGASEPE